MIPAGLKQRVHDLLGPRGYLDQPHDLALYEYDAGVDKHAPDLVAFPRSTAETAALVKLAQEFGVPFVGRGAGTGLSGGAIPREGGLMIAFARMNRILELDLENERAVVQPGVVNLDITLAVEGSGYFFAPDPSSQRACTIGGNVAENAGGPHTLAYGVTTNHVLGLEMVLPDGTVVETGGKTSDLPGYDLVGLLTGSEGTMVLITKVIVRLMRKAEAVKTILAIYESSEDAGRTVAEITARAITPVALEMLDGVMLRMVEEATHAGYPDGCGGGPVDRTGRHPGSRGGAGGTGAPGLHGVRRARVPRGAHTRRARPVVEGPQERIRRGGPRQPDLLCAGWGGAAYPDRAHAALHRRGGAEVWAHHQQHLPRRRRQHAPYHSVRRAPAGRYGKGLRRGPGDPLLVH